MSAVTKIKNFLENRRGSVLVEIAMSLPIIVGMVMGGFELARFSLVHQKMNRLSSIMADLITRAERLNQADFCNAFNAVPFIADPFFLGPDGRVVISYVEGVVTTPGNPSVNRLIWQETGGGTLTATSNVGTVIDGGANLPNGRVLDEGEGVVVAEVFYQFTPLLFDDVITARQIEHMAMLRPRYGALGTIDPQPPVQAGFPDPCA